MKPEINEYSLLSFLLLMFNYYKFLFKIGFY